MKKIIFLILILASIFYLNISKKEINLTDKKILCFGDSITYGYGVEMEHSYPLVLANLTHVNIQNSGINGELSKDGLIRLTNILEKDKFDILVLCHGGNDILRGMDLSKTKSNLKQMIKLAKSKNIKVLLIAVPNPNLGLLGLKSNEIYEELAREENILLEDEILSEILLNQSLKSDQIHPNKQGYELLAKAVFKLLK